MKESLGTEQKNNDCECDIKFFLSFKLLSQHLTKSHPMSSRFRSTTSSQNNQESDANDLNRDWKKRDNG